MFKKLRNNFLITNMLIITALVIGCFSAIYITTYSYIKKDVEERLNRAVDMCRDNIFRSEHEGMAPPPEWDGGHRPEMPHEMRENGERPPMPQSERQDKFAMEISVYCDKEGEIISSHSIFSPEEFDYSDKLKKIVDSDKSKGDVKLDVDSWAYQRVEYEDGYIIAFTKNESERDMMVTLMVILGIVALISIVLSYMISRFSANRSIRPIEESYNKQKQFVADASHELRTPLASISANTDVLLSKDNGIEEKKWLTYIKEETERMTQLTNDLLMLAKSDSADKKMILSEIVFSDIVEDVVLESEAIAFEQGVELEINSEENIKVMATHSGLKQLVLILIDNAVKYAERGGTIKVNLKSDGGKAVFEIENPGTISANDIPHIFERFYRADKSRASRGYGLGLAIAKRLCQSFRGIIDVESKAGKTKFTVVLNKI